VPDNPGRADFEPFYDRIAGYGPAPFLIKIALSVLLGAPFFFGASKLLGVLISSAMLALYFATETFRGTLPYMALKLDPHANDALLERIRQVLSDRLFMVGAIGFGILNFCVGLLLGAPGSGWTLALTYAGYLVAGFSCGMPVVGICGVVRTIDRFAELKPKLDYTEPDRCGGTAVFGSALVRFGSVTMIVGVMISWYILRTPWEHDNGIADLLKWFWVAWPFLLSLIVVLAPSGRIADLLKQLAIRETRELESRLESLTAQIEDASLTPAAREEARRSYLYYRKLRGELHRMRTSPFEPVSWGKYATIFAVNFTIAFVNADLKDVSSKNTKSRDTSVLTTVVPERYKVMLESVADALKEMK
jgi:hypothetical protein